MVLAPMEEENPLGMSNTPRIRELPHAERPREKLIRDGARNVPNRDLIALILGHGTRSVSALALADQLLARFETLVELADASIEELREIQGIGEAKAARLSAAFELARRLAAEVPTDRPLVRSAADVAALLQPQLRHLDREEFHGVFLDTKHRVLAIRTISIGHLNGTLVHPREVFKEAIRRSSDALIVVHNHPSGDPTPSAEDVAVTKRLAAAGRILGIELLDHVIIGGSDYVSLRQQGYVQPEETPVSVASSSRRLRG